jgi:hypothetical protein
VDPTLDSPATIPEVAIAMTGKGDVPPPRRRGNRRAKAPSDAQPPPPTDEPELAWPDPELADLWELRVAAPWATPGEAPPAIVAAASEGPEPTSTESQPGQADRGSNIIIFVAACWISVIAGMLAGYAMAAPPQTGGPGQTASPMTVGRPRAEIAGIVQVDETFDELAIDSKPAAPWNIEGAGPVRIVALPTGVDRSVRIGSDARGNGTALCRPIDVPSGRDAHFAFDFALGHQPSVNAKLVELRRGDAPIVEVVVIAATGEAKAIRVATGIVVPGSAPPRPGAALDVTRWWRVTLTISSRGAVSWGATDSSGTNAGSGMLPEAKGSAPLDSFCVVSPTGTPGAWVDVNEVLIEG